MADAADDSDVVAKAVRPVRPLAMPAQPGETMRRLADLHYQRKHDGESRCLSVGRGISLSGEIKSCDKLFIEGIVEADMTNCRIIEIAEGGLFKGSASIEEAEVRGRFEGNLVVRKRLLIKATGQVSGTIHYGQIEIECGGKIFGDIQVQPAGVSKEVTANTRSLSGSRLPDLQAAHHASAPVGFIASASDDRPGIL
jgi:cytoskeletal protein CcmA (bactofilin family)